jgi:Tol biopolymer transport system component
MVVGSFSRRMCAIVQAASFSLTRGRVRQIDRSFDGGPRRSEGVGRYNSAFAVLDPGITPDGRFVVFTSAFANIVPGDTNRAIDVFVYNRRTRRVGIISRSRSGRVANGDSSHPAISADGRFVVFDSRATNLSPRDSRRDADVFFRDLRTGNTELITVGSVHNDGATGRLPDVSDDGSRVSFVSGSPSVVEGDTNQATDVFVRDRGTATTTRVSVTNDGQQFEPVEFCESASCYQSGAGQAHISGDGSTVVFATAANGLVPEDQNYNSDVFIRDIDAGITQRVSVRDDGGDAYGPEEVECGRNPRCAGTAGVAIHSPSISRDGGLVYFMSAASQLSDEDRDNDGGQSGEEVYVRDRRRDSTLLASRYRDGTPLHSTNWYAGEISPDGRFVTYSCNSMKLDGPRGDEDPGPDVFLQRLPRN